MRFCSNCGSEVPEGAKFCENCGTALRHRKQEVYEDNAEEIYNKTKLHSKDGMREIRREKVNTEGKQEVRHRKTRKNGKRNGGAERRNRKEVQVTPIEKISKLFGIALLIMALIDYYSDPPVLTIFLSVAIVVGGVFCLSQRYRLKVFTIIAMILAVYCLGAGVHQGNRLGYLKIPSESDYAMTNSMNSDTQSSNSKSNNSNSNSSNDTSGKSANGVDPELKKFLDSYEAFVDEYVVFMKKYKNDPTNAMATLTEYTSIMQKYNDFADKVNRYDSKSMSTADAKYYLEVTNRCTQKMLEIY